MLVKTKPYQHQVTGYEKAREILATGPSVALLMEMGTGKSKLSIDIAANLFEEKKIDSVLLIAPNGIHTQWYNEQVPQHCPASTWRMIWENTKSKKYAGSLYDFINTKTEKMRWFFVNVDRFSTITDDVIKVLTDYFAGHRVAVIVDEATRIKNLDAKRTKAIIKIGQRAAVRMILTGTPVTNSPFDVFSMFEFLSPGFWGCNFFTFKHRYGLLIKSDMNGRQFHRAMTARDFGLVKYWIEKRARVEDIAVRVGLAESSVRWIMEHPGTMRPYKNLAELKARIAPLVFSVQKSECLDLPDKIYQTLTVEMDDDQRKVYGDLKKNLIAQYAGVELTVQNKIALALRLQQITGGFFPGSEGAEGKPIGKTTPKLAALVGELEESGDAKVIVWCRFTAEILLISSRLREEFPDRVVECYHGATDEKRRDEIKNAFQSGAVDVLVINQQVGSMGLNLQASTLHYFYSNSFSLEHRMQAEDRSHRIGQTEHVVYKDLICPGTIDERIIDALKNNREVAEYFNQKDIGEIL